MRPVPNGRQRWTLQLNILIHYLLRWLHRSRVVRQETGERIGYLLELQNITEKAQKKTIYRVQLTVE